MGPTQSVVLKLLLSSAALAAALLLIADVAAEIDGGRPYSCESLPASPASAANSSDLYAAFRDLIAMSYLAAGDRALCVGPDSSSSAAAMRRVGFPAAAWSSATAYCGLPFDTDSFDFAFAASLERVRVPARVVLEMERVVRPGRVGVVFRMKPGSTRMRPEDLMKAAAPIASLLRLSDVIGARAVNGSTMVVFKKRGSSVNRHGGRRVNFSDWISKMPLVPDGIIELLRSSANLVGGGYSGHSVTGSVLSKGVFGQHVDGD